MTPGVTQLNKAGISYRLHEYTHDSASESYGMEAANKLGVEQGRVFKTLVVSFGDRELAVAVVPVSGMLNLKAFAKSIGAKKAIMAGADEVERSTGYVLGGVSPLGQKKKLLTRIDRSVENYPTIYVSAGRRGLELELDPMDLLQLTQGQLADISI